MPLVQIDPKKVLRVLVGLSILFIVLNLARLVWGDVMGDLLRSSWSRLDLDQEAAIPTWFSSMLLLSAALTLGAIAVEKRRASDAFARHWVALAIIFLLMSIDEVGSIHELFVHPLRLALDTSGPLRFAWVIPGGLFVIFFVLAYLRFLYHLSPRFRWLFILSGAVYVFGALVMEMVGGEILKIYGRHLLYSVEVMIEEGCEMLGASFFVYAVLAYLQTMVSQVSIGLASHEPMARQSASPAEPLSPGDPSSAGG